MGDPSHRLAATDVYDVSVFGYQVVSSKELAIPVISTYDTYTFRRRVLRTDGTVDLFATHDPGSDAPHS